MKTNNSDCLVFVWIFNNLIYKTYLIIFWKQNQNISKLSSIQNNKIVINFFTKHFCFIIFIIMAMIWRKLKFFFHTFISSFFKYIAYLLFRITNFHLTSHFQNWKINVRFYYYSYTNYIIIKCFHNNKIWLLCY